MEVVEEGVKVQKEAVLIQYQLKAHLRDIKCNKT